MSTSTPPKRRRVLRALAWTLGALLTIGLLAGGAGWYWLERNVFSALPDDVGSLRTIRPPTACRIFSADGREVDRFYLDRRIWVPIAGLPDHVWQAFVAAEDRRFFEHRGVDLTGIARAAWANLREGRTVQGGSTITQQLVKNLLVGGERSYTRKLREAFLARRIERRHGKMELLELYLNLVALGSGNAGVEAAARDYFGVPAAQLDAGQAALLAGLVPAPSRYSPRVDPDQARARRALVLRSMVRDGYLSAEAAARHADDPVEVPARGAAKSDADAYVTAVRRRMRQRLGDELLFGRGVQVHTPLDLDLQVRATDAVRRALVALDARQGQVAVVERLATEDREGFLAAVRPLVDGPTADRPEPGACFRALYDDEEGFDGLRAGGYRFSLVETDREARVRPPPEPLESTPSTKARAPKSGPLAARVRAGDVLRVCRLDDPTQPDAVQLDPTPFAEGAAVVVENATGRVRALVGGRDVPLEGFVRATQARRQPGSSFKPYVYAAAMRAGRSQLDTVLDAPISLPAGGGRSWRPKNYDDEYAGTVTLRRAMARSLNSVAVRLLLERGAGEVAALARAMGVRSPLRTDAALALGAAEVTPLDQAIGFATIARLGSRPDPVFVDRLLDFEGAPIAAAGEPVVVAGRTVTRLPGGPGERVLPTGVAYELADLLREVVRAGTARKAHRPGFDRAGKTGTTNGNVDAWFVGFTPRHTVAVWIGTDGSEGLGPDETGGAAALPAWIEIVDALAEPEGLELPVPDDVIRLREGNTWLGVRRGRAPARFRAAVGERRAPLPAWP